MISIIIPVYNQAKKLDRCLQSIKQQNYENYEIIVVDDGSVDGIDDIVRKYRGIFGYKFIAIKQENQGSNAARNAGFRKAQGEFVLFCDADITMKFYFLRMLREALRHYPDASYAYTSFKWGWKKFKLCPFDADKLKQMPYIHTTSLIRRAHFPGFDENIKRLQDWDLWLTMMEQGHTGIFVNRTLFFIQTGGLISFWLPSFAYKYLPFLPQVIKYKRAVKIIKAKHNLE